MQSDVISKALGVAFCTIACVAGACYLFQLMKEEATEHVQRQQASQTFGPFDQANADLVGLPADSTPARFRVP